MKNFAASRFEKMYDALYTICHVHKLMEPFPFFDVGFSMVVDCSVNIRKRLETLCVDSDPCIIEHYQATIATYGILRQVFADLPCLVTAFDTQYYRWLKRKFMSVDLCDYILHLCQHYYDLDHDFYYALSLPPIK